MIAAWQKNEIHSELDANVKYFNIRKKKAVK